MLVIVRGRITQVGYVNVIINSVKNGRMRDEFSKVTNSFTFGFNLNSF